MARPRKQGLEYFTNDVTFYQDIRIRKLIRYKGPLAVMVYHCLLCQIYTSGYYLPWDDDLPFIIHEVTNIEEDTIKEAVRYSFEIGLFDKAVFDAHHVLTSRSIQERYFSICSLTKRSKSDFLPYYLLSDDKKKINSEKTAVSSEETRINSEETRINSEQTLFNDDNSDINSEETAVNSEFSTQRKEKKSKVKKLTSFAETRTREDSAGGWSGDDMVVYDDVDSEVSELKAAELWREQVFMRYKFLNRNGRLLDEYIDRWAQEVKISGKRHQCLGDAKKHFGNWMTIQEGKSNNGNHGTAQQLTAQQRINEGKIRGAQHVAELLAQNDACLRDSVQD